MLGSNTSASQITNIEHDGFWLLVNNEELFVPFDRYPAFKQAMIEQIFNFEVDEEQYHWPQLDIDIELDALRHPERFPLIFKE